MSEQANFINPDVASDPVQALPIPALQAPLASSEAISNWQYEDGSLVETPMGSHNHHIEASKILDQEGVAPNTPMVHFIANAINTYRDSQLKLRVNDQAEIDKQASTLAIPNLPAPTKTIIESNVSSLIAARDARGDFQGDRVNQAIQPTVKAELAEAERSEVMQAVNQRIDADRLPWTMPGSTLPSDVMDGLKTIHHELTSIQEAGPNDVFKVAPPMQKFEGKVYSPEDRSLLQRGGIDLEHRPERLSYLQYTRAELQQAGVFFINRVGAGEQPIFGMPIPDPNSPGGFFNVQDRSFLTREEFEIVYKYQQEHGFGLEPGQDPADVQMDMLVFAAMPDARQPECRKGSGFGSRENKYGLVRSPFVDLGFYVNHGVETTTFGHNQRMNTTSIHLANAHPDYPGVSEMFVTEATAHDQKYMSVGEFVKTFYKPLPTKEEAYTSIRYNLPTARERAWVLHSDWKE